MAATLSLHVYTSTNAATESSAVTGIDLVSADNATNTVGNRQSYPVVVGTNSYEKYMRMKIDVAPANGVGSFKFWTTTSAVSNVLFKAKMAIGSGGATPGTGGSTPVNTAMAGSSDAYTFTSGAKGNWDTASYVTINNVTKAFVLQLQPNGSATPGDWACTCNWSYDES